MTASLESGLNFVLLHLEEPIFPRRIATDATEGKQILVNNSEEALARFKQSNLLDCRISAEATIWGIIVLVFSVLGLTGMGLAILGTILGIIGGAIALSSNNRYVT
jgi:hypothetical protein